MADGTGRTGAPGEYTLRFVTLLDEWARTHGRLLDALVELRGPGLDAGEAVEALLAVKPVRVLRVSWELWGQLVTSAGDDPDTILLDRLPRQLVEHARLALWGTPWRPHLSVVPK